MTEQIIDTAILEKRVDSKHSEIFLDLLSNFYLEDDRTEGKVRGNILEYIIAQIGPFETPEFNENADDIVLECFFTDKNGNRVGGENDFDVGFICKYDSIKELISELLESKVDLNNFLAKNPSTPNDLTMREDAINKLNYMNAIIQVLASSRRAVVALVTARYQYEHSKALITKYGYDNISIYNCNDIKRLFFLRKLVSA